MDTAHAPGPEDDTADSTSIFFVIESRAWSRPSQLRIRKSDRIPRRSPKPQAEGAGPALPGRCHRLLPPHPLHPLPYPHAAPTLQASTLLRRPNPPPQPSAATCGSRASPGAWDLFHTPPAEPLFPICDLFRAPPPRPSSPIWTARIQPATAKQVQSWATSPIAGRTDESKLRRFWRGSSPVAGPRRPRKRPAEKTRWHESNRLEPTAILRRAEAWDPMSQPAEAGGAGLALPMPSLDPARAAGYHAARPVLR